MTIQNVFKLYLHSATVTFYKNLQNQNAALLCVNRNTV